MPIYDIHCGQCGADGEVLALRAGEPLYCPSCGSTDTVRRMSATSSLTGRSGQPMPGPGDTACCGSRPGEGQCAGPGSCCGKHG